jgi:hypothetical protein
MITPSSKEITCWQTVYLFALHACKDDSEEAILKSCSKPIENLLIKDAMSKICKNCSHCDIYPKGCKHRYCCSSGLAYMPVNKNNTCSSFKKREEK